MKKVLVLILLTLATAGCAKKPFPASRLPQPAGHFSFVTPDGWFRSKLPGMEFLVISGPADFGMQPNIFVEGTAPATNLAEAAAGLVGRYKSNYPSYAVSTQVVFATISGMRGTKIVAHRRTRESLPVSLCHYIVLDRGRVIEVTCSCSQPAVSRYEPIFDAAMKSMEADLSTHSIPRGTGVRENCDP